MRLLVVKMYLVYSVSHSHRVKAGQSQIGVAIQDERGHYRLLVSCGFAANSKVVEKTFASTSFTVTHRARLYPITTEVFSELCGLFCCRIIENLQELKSIYKSQEKVEALAIIDRRIAYYQATKDRHAGTSAVVGAERRFARTCSYLSGHQKYNANHNNCMRFALTVLKEAGVPWSSRPNFWGSEVPRLSRGMQLYVPLRSMHQVSLQFARLTNGRDNPLYVAGRLQLYRAWLSKYAHTISDERFTAVLDLTTCITALVEAGRGGVRLGAQQLEILKTDKNLNSLITQLIAQNVLRIADDQISCISAPAERCKMLMFDSHAVRDCSEGAAATETPMIADTKKPALKLA